MVDAYNYIQKGSNDSGQLPPTEIIKYYDWLEEYMVETKQDFIYLIHVMNQPILEKLADDLEKAKNRK